MRHDRINYRCPTCGHQTIVIDASGWLVCSWLPCRNPAALHDIIEAALSPAVGRVNDVERGREATTAPQIKN